MNGKQSLLHLPPAAGLARSWRSVIVGAAMLMILAACDRTRGLQMTAETDEPRFRHGKQALAANQKAQALEDFQKVIDKRQGDAPESHFEVGKIYLEHIKDYPPAIYHFRRYLELTGPNGPYAPQVNQMIETARKEFARQLAGNPLEAQYDRLDLLDKIDKLTAENNTLRAELERYVRGGRANVGAVRATPPPDSANAGPPARTSSAWTNAIPDAGPAPDVVPVNPPTASNNAAMAPATRAPATSGRTYTIERGDTLVAISRKLYGSASHWRAIYDANRDRIPDPNALRIGTEIRLP